MKKIPDTPVIKEALSIVKAALSTNVFNHSLRSYYFAGEYAEKYNYQYSEEELLLVALFHDLGFYSPYKIKGKSFQIGSSLALKEFLLENKNIPAERINAMMEAIDYHFQFRPRWDKSEIAGLIQIGTHLDVIGRNLLSIDKNKRLEIISAFPKKNFFWEFNICLFKSFSDYQSLKGLFYPESLCTQNHYLGLS